MSKLLTFTLTTREWGNVLILRPIPTEEDAWGELGILRGTPWGDALPIVSGEVFSNALHGHATPLMRVIGTPPIGLLRKIRDPFRVCENSKACIGFREKDCVPGKTMPMCYIPPGMSPEVREVAATVALAWKEGRYVVIVEGPEFNL